LRARVCTVIGIVLGVVALLVGGGGVYFYKKKALRAAPAPKARETELHA
jgi:LPXTG-motif cell wall-anchored protein